MTQPKDLPVWATTANYPAGGDPWNGQPRRVEPSSGAQAAGLTPGDQPPAEVANYLFGRTLDHLACIADSAAFNYYPPRSLFNGNFPTGGLPRFPSGSFTPTSHPVICTFGVDDADGNRHGAIAMLADDTYGRNVFTSLDGGRWTIGTADLTPLGTGTRPFDMAASPTHLAVPMTKADASHDVLYSTDGGSSWTAAGFALTSDGTHIVWTGEGGLDHFIWSANEAKIFYCPGTFPGSHSSIVTTSDYAATRQLCVAPYQAGVQDVLQLSTSAIKKVGRLAWSGSAFLWTEVTVDAVTNRHFKSACYSIAHAAWFLISEEAADGFFKVWRAATAAGPWSLVSTITATAGACNEIVAFGRSLVMAPFTDGLPVRVSSDGGVTWKAIHPWPSFDASFSESVAPAWIMVREFFGQILLARWRGAGTSDAEPEFSLSHILPSEVP